MPHTYDAIVLGLGGFGSSALYHLARRGKRVLGLEQFTPGHDRGSSHGETRIIRKAYFEHPDYVPLLQQAYQLWEDLEQRTGKRLLEKVGLFIAGPEYSPAVAGTWSSAQQHKLTVERMTPPEATQRFPGFCFHEEDVILFEREAGFLHVEESVHRHLHLATQHSAEIRTNTQVHSWTPTTDGVQVHTSQGSFTARSLVVTAGPWSGAILRELQLPLQVRRKIAFWYGSPPDQFRATQGSPTFFFERPAGQFYGFPNLQGDQVKLAEHTGGEIVADPALADRELHPDDLERIAPFVAESLPALQGIRKHSHCFYTCTPDGHFIIDRHPEHPQVVIGAGFSGHGFKFTTVLGDALAALAVEGTTEYPIEFLGLQRFASPPE